MKKYFLFILFLFTIFFSLQKAEASGDVIITPSIIDEKAKAREIFDYNIKIKNTTDKKIEMFVFSQDVNVVDGKTEILSPSMVDRTNSLSKWITIKRLLKIQSQEEITLPMRINVDMDAIPGKYYNVLTFSPGSNVDIAKKNLEQNQAQIMINIEVEEEIIEKAQVEYFKPVKNVNLSYPVDLAVSIKNSGNRDIVPQGNIFIYDRKNRQVGMLDFNEKLNVISPESSNQFITTWKDFKGFGKMKAKLELEYGDKDKRDLQDTIFFWVLPWTYLVIFCVALFLLTIIMVIINKKTHKEKPKSNRPNVDGIINLKVKK